MLPGGDTESIARGQRAMWDDEEVKASRRGP